MIEEAAPGCFLVCFNHNYVSRWFVTSITGSQNNRWMDVKTRNWMWGQTKQRW